MPGSHFSIQEAIDDASCSTIDLTAQIYEESIYVPRSLAIVGPGTGGAVIRGLVWALGSGSQVMLVDFEVENGCAPNSVLALSGAEILGAGLSVRRADTLPCPLILELIFADGFESGDTSAWSSP